jgi:hypothetical protein
MGVVGCCDLVEGSEDWRRAGGNRLPRLVRIALASERARRGLEYLQILLSEEILWAWTRPPQREAVNRSLYSRQDRYLRGGWIFDEGLSAWERAAFTTPPFPARGKILLGGAGGGRELLSLCGMGFDVVAFEPSERLCAGAQEIVSAYPNSTVVRASYEDLIRSAEQGTGPLADYVLGASFDAVIFGLASFSYLFTEAERQALLRATRRIAPTAPVLFSFLLQSGETSKFDRIRPAIRRMFRLLNAPGARLTGDRFHSDTGFIHALTAGDVRTVAERSGYRTVYCRLEDFPHALLIPESPRRDDAG